MVTDLWRKLSIYVVIPALCIGSVNAWRLWSEHWEHKSHEPPVEERTEYPYMNIRTKNFFWGDGDKVSCMPPSTFLSNIRQLPGFTVCYYALGLQVEGANSLFGIDFILEP